MASPPPPAPVHSLAPKRLVRARGRPPMSLSIEEFRKRLTESGIMSRAEVDAFRESHAGGPQDVPPTALAQALVEADRLTAFQADALLSETARPVKLGNYRLVDVIGQGGMGQVYKALHERMNRVVAIKVLPPLAAMDAGLVARFHREVHVAAKLHHPHIVTAYDADEANGLHFLVMEYMPGRDLAEVVEGDGPLSIDQGLDYTLQAARALQYAHGEGVLHRDIKPANLLVDDEGHVKVLDMGLARLEASDGLTVSGEVLGTAATMAPEQGDDVHAVDERSDIYGLGCTLYYLLGGRHMYEGDSALQVLVAHASRPIPKLRDVCPEASPDLERFFEGLVQKDKENRYPDMQAVIDAITALRGGAAPEVPATRTRRKSLAPWWAVAALLAIGLVVGGVVLLNRGSDDPGPGVTDTHTLRAELRHVMKGHRDSVRDVVFHPDGQRLISACKDGTIGIWDLESGTLTHQLEGHKEDHPVRCVLCLRDGKTLISSSDDSTIRIWDLTTRTTTKVLRGHTDKVRELGLAPDESWLASASKDGTIRIWDLPAGTERVQVRGTTEPEDDTYGVLSLSVHPDGRTIATTNFDQTVRVWLAENLEMELQHGPSSVMPGMVKYSRDGAYLLYDTGFGDVRVLSGDGKSEEGVLKGHYEGIYGMAFTPDGRYVATGGRDTTVKLWRLPEGPLIETLRGHKDGLDVVAINQDGTLLASGSGDNTIRLYDLR